MCILCSGNVYTKPLPGSHSRNTYRHRDKSLLDPLFPLSGVGGSGIYRHRGKQTARWSHKPSFLLFFFSEWRNYASKKIVPEISAQVFMHGNTCTFIEGGKIRTLNSVLVSLEWQVSTLSGSPLQALTWSTNPPSPSAAQGMNHASRDYVRDPFHGPYTFMWTDLLTEWSVCRPQPERARDCELLTKEVKVNLSLCLISTML
jgi:hypothetical protein